MSGHRKTALFPYQEQRTLLPPQQIVPEVRSFLTTTSCSLAQSHRSPRGENLFFAAYFSAVRTLAV